jgi:hypothetical protein
MESRIRKFLTLIPVCIAILAGLCIRGLAETEAQQVEARLLAPPVIKTEPGFRAKILVPPGQLYDPLFVFMHNGAAWLTDDGGEVDGTGSRIVSVNGKGKVTVIVPYTLTVPMIAGGFAPSGFGKLTGQIIMFSQPKTDFDGAFMNHVIQQLDPAKNYAHTIVCTLPKAGELSNGVPGVGVDARFGPPNTPFRGSVLRGDNAQRRSLPDGWRWRMLGLCGSRQIRRAGGYRLYQRWKADAGFDPGQHQRRTLNLQLKARRRNDSARWARR